MHYYKRNIGDYAKKAGRLSILQHGVYNLLIDACYDREKFPTRDEALDWVWASTPEEEQALDFVLRKFFTLEDGVHIQKRIAEEIEKYQEFCREQAAKGKGGGRPKKQPAGHEEKPVGFTEEPDGNPPESNRGSKETLTTNQEPLTTTQESKGSQASRKLTFDAWVEKIREAGEKPIPDDHAVIRFTEDAGIPHEFLAVCWEHFKGRYSGDQKKYIDWRKVFANAVRENWFKLWWHDGNGYQLTTVGQQGMNVLNNKQRKSA